MHNKTLAKIRKILYNKIIKTNECKQQIEKKGKNVKKKKIKKILTVLVATTLLGGCGSSAASQQTSTEALSENISEEATETTAGGGQTGTVELKVWAEENQLEVMQKMIDSFEENYAGQATFDITLEAMADVDTKKYLLDDVHNGADVFSFPDDQLDSMVAGGALDVVTDEAIKSANLEEAVNASMVNDTLYAYPMTADNGYFLYYDKNYFSPEEVTSLDSILAKCQQGGKKMSMDVTSGWYLYSFFGNTGLEMGLNDDGITNHCNWNATEGNITGVDVAQALLAITQNPGFAAMSDGDFIEGAKNGTVVAGVSGTWNAKTMEEIWGKDYGACKLPTYTCKGQQIQMSSFKGYKMLGVNYYSKNKEWAHKLAAWMTNEENQTLRFNELNVGPANANVASSDAVKQVPAIVAVMEQAQYGTLQRIGNSYWTPCVRFAEKIVAGNPANIPLQELVDELASGISAS